MAPALALAAAVAATLVSCSGDADFSDAMPTPVVLSAEDYQREITAIDRLVFEEKPMTEARRVALAAKLEALAGRMRASNDSLFIKLESLETRRLASLAKNLSPEAPRDALRNNWMRIRNNVFDDRAWFARSAADLARPPGT